MAYRSTRHRYLGLLVRTGHLAGVVGVVAAARVGAPAGPWADLLLVSGAALVADELWRFGTDWFRWTQAWVLGAKLLVFGAFHVAGHAEAGLWAAFVLGSLIAHAPGALRHAAIVGSAGPCARSTGDSRSRAPSGSACHCVGGHDARGGLRGEG